MNTVSCFIYLSCWNEPVWLEVASLASYSKDDNWEAFEDQLRCLLRPRLDHSFPGNNNPEKDGPLQNRKWSGKLGKPTSISALEEREVMVNATTGSPWANKFPSSGSLIPRPCPPSPGSHLSQNHQIALSVCLPSPSFEKGFIYLCLCCCMGFL